jgi:hypothetical protein
MFSLRPSPFSAARDEVSLEISSVSLKVSSLGVAAAGALSDSSCVDSGLGLAAMQHLDKIRARAQQPEANAARRRGNHQLVFRKGATSIGPNPAKLAELASPCRQKRSQPRESLEPA